MLGNGSARAQNECTARGMGTIAVLNENGVSHQVLCYDKQNARSCSPQKGACGELPVSSPKPAIAPPELVETPSFESPAEPPQDLQASPFQAGTSDTADEPRPRTREDEDRSKPAPDDQQSQSGSQLAVRVPRKEGAPAAIDSKSIARPETVQIIPQSTVIRAVAIASTTPRAEAMQTEHLVASPPREMAGQADVALQGYYQAATGQSIADTTGSSIRLQNFFPSLGLITASFEGYGSQGSFRLGENFARLSGVSLWARHWDLGLGDFRVPLSTVTPVFPNVDTTELFARGLDVTMTSSRQTIRLFEGEETLMQGPRVPFRLPAPQRVAGAIVQRKVGHLQFGLRYLHTSSSQSQIADNSAFFPTGRRFLSGDEIALQAVYRPAKFFQFFAEGAASKTDQLDSAGQTPRHFSFVAGPELNTKMFTLRANYVFRGNSYLPIVGSYAGDRQGPYGEVRFRPFSAIELFGSASRYSSNVDRNPEIPTYHTTGYSGGVSAALPWKFNASAQVSAIDFNSTAVSVNPVDATIMGNRQISFSLSRPVKRHTLRASAIDLANRTNRLFTTQHLAELEDSFTWRGLALSGAARFQRLEGMDAKNSVFYRGTARFNIHGLSLYGSFEAGNDLVNKTLLATNSLNSTVIGASAPLFRGWALQLEAFRNNLTTDLNPASIFVLGGRGVDVPMTVASLNQWSVFFRLNKQIRWGSATPAETMEQYTARQIPLVGTVEGIVMENLVAANHAAAGIPVRLDGYRVAFSDATGYFQFADVPEGIHKVGPALDELPADVELDGIATYDVKVSPRLRSRADFRVAPLLSVSGRVEGPKGVAVETVVIRVHPSARYTTPDPDGSFAFFNLREGSYEVSIDPSSLPEDVVIASPGSVTVNLQSGVATAPVNFQLAVEHRELPIQRVIEQRIDAGSVGQGNRFQPQLHERD